MKEMNVMVIKLLIHNEYKKRRCSIIANLNVRTCIYCTDTCVKDEKQFLFFAIFMQL